MHLVKVALSTLSSLLEPTMGVGGTAFPLQPALPIKLYEFEGCPYCRRVRQALTHLNLDVEIYPCPKGGKRFRPEAIKLSGKAQFPLLVDDNTGTVLLESADIIAYLYKQYGSTGQVPSKFKGAPSVIRGSIATAVSGMRGMKAASANQNRSAPEQKLVLWSFDMSPFTRLVRERLCELEIPYLLVNVAKEKASDMGLAVARLHTGEYKPVAGGKRERLYKAVGKIQMPYLIDPNTGVAMHESKAILAYLNETYAK